MRLGRFQRRFRETFPMVSQDGSVECSVLFGGRLHWFRRMALSSSASFFRLPFLIGFAGWRGRIQRCFRLIFALISQDGSVDFSVFFFRGAPSLDSPDGSVEFHAFFV